MIITRTSAVTAARAARLAQAKIEARNTINEAIGAKRGEFITVLPGQDLIYNAKETEAKAYLTSADPDPADYPLLNAEVGITAPTIYEVAQIVFNLAVMWRWLAAALEALRLGMSAEVANAQTISEVEMLAGGTDERIVAALSA